MVGEAQLGQQESSCDGHPERLTGYAPPRSAMHATERKMTTSISSVAEIRTFLRMSKQVPRPLGGILSLAQTEPHDPFPVPGL